MEAGELREDVNVTERAVLRLARKARWMTAAEILAALKGEHGAVAVMEAIEKLWKRRYLMKRIVYEVNVPRLVERN